MKERGRCRWKVGNMIMCCSIVYSLSLLHPPSFTNCFSNTPALPIQISLPSILRTLSPSSYQLTSHSPLMAMEQDLSTPQCPAEERAWLFIHQARMRGKKSLVEAFNSQFPARESADILRHAASVRDDHKVHSQLQNLARQFPCIKIRRKREKVALSK